MNIPEIKETYVGRINNVLIGATPAEGGTRSKAIRIGGHSTVPFLSYEGETTPPAFALEVPDIPPEPGEWPDALIEPYKDVLGDPVAWARKCEQEYGADMICIRLLSIHPDRGNVSAAKARETVLAIRSAVKVPLIIWGCDDDPRDNEVLPVISQALAGEKCLFGMASQENYKTLVASCMADGHSLLGLSPLDINIAKQVNILVSDMGLPSDRIVMYPTTGALGYGIEYTYSIMERGRLAALAGDKMLAMPVFCVIGPESWKTKESKASETEFPQWGPAEERGILWESMTATTLLQAGADILLMRHPEAMEITRLALKNLFGAKA